MFVLRALAGALAFAICGNAQVDLGMAASFGIIGSTAITNTGPSVVNGDMGITPNGRTSITGFPPGIVTGTIEAANARAAAARDDAVAAYNAAAASVVTTDKTGQDLGGQVLPEGVYGFSSSAGITGVLTLDGRGNPASMFIFKIGSTLTTATAASVVLINGARPCNVYFQVGSSATLGTGTDLVGNVLALTSITVNDGVAVNGGLYALNAAVTLINDRVTAPGDCAGAGPPPPPSSVSNTPVQSSTGTDIATITPSTPGSSSNATTASVTKTTTSLSRTTLITSTVTRKGLSVVAMQSNLDADGRAASESDKPKSTKTKKDKTSTKSKSLILGKLLRQGLIW